MTACRCRAACALLLLPFSLLAQSQGGGASGGVLRPLQACYDVQHYDLRLRVDPEREEISGTLRMRARITGATKEIELDLHDALSVARVAAEGLAAHQREGGRIRLRFADELTAGSELVVEIEYGGAPREARNPPWDGGFTWARTADGAPWIATSCQGEGADLWWPCKDHPADKPESMDLRIRIPKGLFCASNGTLQSDRDEGDGTHTQHWHIASPISNYCVALNIAPYAVVEDTYRSVTGDDVPVFFWVLPEDLDNGKRALPEFLDHLRFFEEVLGPYPFRHEKYGIAQTPHLGMEHQTVIAYGNKFRKTQFGYDWLHNHELSHEWWGNLVTCRDWKDMWIHEGFGTYMQPLYLESRRGVAAMRADLWSKHRFGNRRAIAPRESQDSKEIYFGRGGGNDIYYKGAWVLHTLRWLLGDEKFFLCLRRFCYPTPELEKVTDGSQVRLVDTEDFVALASKIAGRDLGWYFEVYVRQPELPRLIEEERGGALHLRWQVPIDVAFPLPVPVQVGDAIRRVEMGGGSAVLELHGDSYRIDPERWILRSQAPF